ncbi:SDR family NAD(P)-dependent oxidoreductase [Sphingobium sp. YR768]|uniref:SDR family NAD(P)-dependent oxidoreductase n=1 Tax=Sphingobium sp. YR768 TaxID=1884365 RepID=UPI0008D26407|nr:SDR family NAD(P)-dependent oxidoreductase [Sphingobium sp. YR768]SER84399.1 NAD(P)-dependent dehydrogenase, short-chain alcohol dehydrogenase family [Sphingobium sp. YR768]
MGEFAGKTAIVTGGSRGIGLTVATLLVERGARVVLVGRNASALTKATEGLGEAATMIVGDIAQADTATRAVAKAIGHGSGLDILANIAGIFPTARIEETTDALYADTIAANLSGTMIFCRAAFPILRERGGAIVNMSSTAARFPTPGLSAYAASKAGVEAFTRTLAAEGAPYIRVNAVSAGPTRTETVDALMASDTTGAVHAVTSVLPLGRLAEPREIAEAILFLASSRASFITGQILHANGGGLMA